MRYWPWDLRVRMLSRLVDFLIAASVWSEFLRGSEAVGRRQVVLGQPWFFEARFS